MKIGNLEVYGIIYKITNLVNGKVYIGQTVEKRGFNGRYKYSGIDIEKVYKHHKHRKNKGNRYNNHLYNSIKKYGFEAFKVVKIFDFAFSKEELDIKEEVWINYFDCINNGYNNMSGGSSGRPSKETIEKSSRAKFKKVICLTTNKVFESIKFAGEYYGINYKYISECCLGKRKTGGKLADGTKLMWTYYNSTEEERQKILNAEFYNYSKVICITTNKIFNSIKEAGMYYKCTSTNISMCCRKTTKSAGKLNNIPLQWLYYDEYTNMKNEDIQSIISEYKPITSKVICITTKIIFNSINQAIEYYKCSKNISQCCKGKRNYCGKLPDGTKLQWKYISDLTEEECIKYNVKNKLKELNSENQESSISKDGSFLLPNN
jgi:hypothetical protein